MKSGQVLDIPGVEKREITNLIFDFNGTLARRGQLIEGVYEKLKSLSELYHVYILSTDTFGTVEGLFADTDVDVVVTSKVHASEEKRDFIERLGWEKTLAVGNGSVDRLMLATAGLSFAVVESEGASVKALMEADVIFKSIHDVLDVIADGAGPIIATLRE